MFTALVASLPYVAIGYWCLVTLSNAVSSMSKPKREDGAYAFWYKFLHMETGNLDDAFEKKFHMTLPAVLDQTATHEKITSPTGTVETDSATLSTKNP